MITRLEKLFYVTENKFGFENYRKPIVWFDKLLVVGGILAGIIGRLCAGVWVVKFVLDKYEYIQTVPLLIIGILLWTGGEYFLRTGNRGLIYHHMDLLLDYLDKSIKREQTYS